MRCHQRSAAARPLAQTSLGFAPVWSLAVVGLGLLWPTAAAAQTLTELVAMRDGVRLATDVYLPAGGGPWPVVLIRTPYGKASHATFAENLNGAGLAVVAQDVRGRFDSEGTARVFISDGDGVLKDGYDTMTWIQSSAWCSGKVATFGGSALGIAQYMLASTAPPGLVLVNPKAATPNLYQDAFFQGGVFRESLIRDWLEAQGNLSFLAEIAAHPYEDSFWDPVQTADRYGDITTAGLHEGGWYDVFLQGTLDAFMGYQTAGGPGALGRQKLIIGPWTHATFQQPAQGELIYPMTSTKPPYATAFFTLVNDYLDLGLPITDRAADVPTVQYYVMGDVDNPAAPGNLWRAEEVWPPLAAPVRMYLHNGGDLSEACPAGGAPSTTYTYEPGDPSPTLCGANHLSLAAGPCDQRPLEARADVVVFSSEVLSAPMEITGRVRAHIFVDIDRPDTDLMVRMSDVYPDGRAMLIADGALRLASRGSTTGLTPLQTGEIVEAVVDLWSTSIILDTGHRLRVYVTSSNWPRFAANHNNGLDYPDSIEGPSFPVVVNLHHEVGHASYLELPNPSRALDDYVTCEEVAPMPDGGEVGDAANSSDDAGFSCRVGNPGSSSVSLLLFLLLGLVARSARHLRHRKQA